MSIGAATGLIGCQFLLDVAESSNGAPNAQQDAASAPTPMDAADRTDTRTVGQAVILAGGQTSARSLQLNLTHVYWALEATATAMRVEKDGTGTAFVVGVDFGTDRQSRPRSLFLEPTAVFLTRDHDYGGAPIWSIDLATDAGVAHEGSYQCESAGEVRGLSTSSVAFYFTLPRDAGIGRMQRSNKGCEVYPVAGDLPEAIAATDDDKFVFWSSVGDSAVYALQAAAAGSDARIGRRLVSPDPQPGVTAIGVDGSHVYWSTKNEIRRAPLAGGAVTDIATGQATVNAMVLYEDFVYWAAADGTIRAALRTSSGGSGTIVVTRQPTVATSLAVDGTGIYLASAGNIVRFPFE